MSIITPLPQGNQIERKEITISISGTRLKLSAPNISLNPGELSELVWRFNGEQSGELMIEFKPAANANAYDSPFRGSLFRCPKGGGSLSGRPLADKARTNAYKYTVTLTTKDANGKTAVRTATGSVLVPPPGFTSKPKKKAPAKAATKSAKASTDLNSAKAAPAKKSTARNAAALAKSKTRKDAVQKARKKQ